MKTNPTTPATTAAPTAPPTPADTEHLRNHTLAQALFATWSGDPATIIDSPPGAGKTHLITHLAHLLHTRAGMTIAIAAQTRSQAIDVADRTATLGSPTVFHTDANRTRPHGLNPAVTITRSRDLNPAHGITIATTARWAWVPTNRRTHFDALLIDEAYQLTYADLGILGALADQFVLVGDPGQIAPVVTGTTRRWTNQPTAPHLPAPEALAAAHDADISRLHLTQTWRLGPDTARLLAPLYPHLPFDSARLPRRLTEPDGTTLSEYRAVPARTAGPTDPAPVHAAADTVRALLGTTLITPDGTRPLLAADIAVICPHVWQAALAAAALADLPDTFVGTINQAQGLQREAIVAVHPLSGHDTADEFATDLGRLCVALSRHRTHLTVITDPHTREALSFAAAARPEEKSLSVQGAILDALTAGC